MAGDWNDMTRMTGWEFVGHADLVMVPPRTCGLLSVFVL